MPDRLTAARHRAVGSRQTLRALENGTAITVFIADDAEERVTAPLKDLCRRTGVQLVSVESMRELGKYCAINVGAAAAAIVRAAAPR